MSKVLFSLFFIGTSAMAAPIFCGSKSSPYRIEASNDRRTATITLNGQVPQFGKLTCQTSKQLVCHSPHVADAGYSAVFTQKHGSLDIFVQIGELWIGGTRPVATLPCVQALN